MLAYRFLWVFFMLLIVVPAGLNAADMNPYLSFSERVGSIHQIFYFQSFLGGLGYTLDIIWSHLIALMSLVFPNSATVSELKSEPIFLGIVYFLAVFIQPPYYISEKAWPEAYARRAQRAG